MVLTIKIFLFNLLLILTILRGEVQNNLVVINSAIHEIILDTIIDNYLDNEDSIAVVIKDVTSEEKEYILLNICEGLLAKSYNVFRNFIPDYSFHGYVLEIGKSSIHVIYSKPYNKKLFGKSFVKRKIITSLGFQLYKNQSHQILESIIKTTEKEDEIEYNQINEVEKSPYSFTIGQKSGYSFWHKMFEPILVISSCTVIVYMFFVQRI